MPKPTTNLLRLHPAVHLVEQVPELTQTHLPRGNRHHRYVRDPNPVDHSRIPTLCHDRDSGSIPSAQLPRIPTVVFRLLVSSIYIVLHFCSVTDNLLHKRASLVETVRSVHHPVRLESRRWRVKVQVVCLIWCQIRLMMNPFTLV